MRHFGFTLVELLVAMATGLLVVTAALLALSTTFSAWTKLAAGGSLLETQRALLRLERDIASALPLPDAPFSGDTTTLSIPLERASTLAVASWSIQGSTLVRHETDYPISPATPLAPARIESFRVPSPIAFSFFATKDASEPLSAFTASTATNLPHRVLLSIGSFHRNAPTRLSSSPESTSP